MNENRTVRSTGKGGYIPSIDVNDESNLHTQIPQNASNRVTLSQLVPSKRENNSSREIVGIEDILPETIKNDNESAPGVDIKESPQAEILKPGGIFDKYVEEKKKEMMEVIEREENKGRWDEQGNPIDDRDSDTEGQNSDEIEEEEILRETNDPSDSIEEYEMKEIISEDNDFPDENDTKKEDKTAPFYTSTGYEDDFEYLDNYDNLELPRDEDETVEEKSSNTIVEKTEVDIPQVDLIADEDDDLESLENEDNIDSQEVRLNELRDEITAKIKPRAKSLNLSGFTIANKATASNKILEIKTASAGKWALINTGICIQVREISGQKIEYMRGGDREDYISVTKKRLRTIYDHTISPKPNTFEAWLKTIAFADYDHLFMPVYLAAFDQANYMPSTCVIEPNKVPRKDTGCGRMFISDNIDIMSCVKFKDDAAKKRFWNLYRSDRYNSEGLYVSEVIPISNYFAISFKNPSLYDTLFEPASYGREFMDKYSNIIGYMPYIDNIYWIDYNNSTLVKVDYKRYDNNASKTAKSKVIRYSKVFDTFKTDEYSNVQSIIASLNESRDDIEYIVPEMTCPECGRIIKSEPSSAQDLLFTRHRLGILANSSIN